MSGPFAYWDMSFEPDRTVVDWGPAIRDTLEHAASEMSFADVPVGVPEWRCRLVGRHRSTDERRISSPHPSRSASRKRA